MIKTKKFLFFILIVLTHNFFLAQEKGFDNSTFEQLLDKTIIKYSMNKVKAQTIVAFNHSADTKIDNGFSVFYGIFGFASMGLGQFCFNYKTDYDSYFIATGFGNLLGGFNKSIYNFRKETFYINGTLGFTFSEPVFLYSIGLSYNYILTEKSQIELSADGFIHPGSTYEYEKLNQYYTRGVTGLVTYSHNFFENFTLAFSLGATFFQKRFMEKTLCNETEGQENVCYYYYKNVDLNEEKQSTEFTNPQWEKLHWSFPFNVTISYHF
ncbi:MAG: hypothetical protein IPH62_02675 [Ignavibacteriae bacterium]|nr:hypothetical protein [Ignavibacteriota bacterium]